MLLTGKALIEMDMPVVSNIPINLEIMAVLRREGFGKQTEVRPEIKNIVLELLNYVEEAHLLEPSMAYEIYSASEMGNRQIFQANSTHSAETPFHSFVAEAEEFAVVVCTIGSSLEQQVTNYSKQKESLRAMLLDGIGSAAIDILTQEACQIIANEVSSQDFQVSSPINPGMPILPITKQRELLAMVPSQEIGVSLTSSGIMVPRKSTSMVVGIGPQMETWALEEVCAHCNLKETCPYRIRA